MDRFVVREPRVEADYPQGNQMIAFAANAGGNKMIAQETMYFGGYASEFPAMQQRIQHVPNTGIGFMPVQMTTASYGQNNMGQVQGQIVSGIDPRYLSAYSDNNAQFIVTGQQMQREQSMQTSSVYGGDYQNRNFMGAERNKTRTFTPQVVASQTSQQGEHAKGKQYASYNNLKTDVQTPQQVFHRNSAETPQAEHAKGKQYASYNNLKTDVQTPQQVFHRNSTVPTKNPNEVDLLKSEVQNQIMSRSDKLKALYKSGPRVFSGPVDKVLKWHKAVQDIGVLVLYEVVAKCVSIRSAESCAKNLVVRDDNGPAMQVVYHEIDFLLPELKPPCTIRIIGRMMPGTSRLQAFNIRLATGDDVAMLPRRTAVAIHHVAKLCKEYGVHN